jgi:UDP-N-acetylglucosamine:LPS N-acetylglucosamine transferase
MARPLETFFPFCNDTSLLLSAIDLLTCRIRAETVAEAMLFGLSTIFVPYPSVAENHQKINATYVASNGRAIIVRQSDIDLLTNVFIECFGGNLKNCRISPPPDNRHFAVEVIVNHAQNDRK